MGAARTRHEQRDALILALSTDPAIRRGELDAAVRRITQAAAEELEVARVSVWFFEERRNVLRCHDLYEGGTHVAGAVLTQHDYPAYFAAMTSHRILAADDAHRDARTSEFSERYLAPSGITSMLDAPVRVHGELVGVLCHEHVGPKRVWTIEEQMFAAALADLVAQASSSAKVHDREPVLADLTGDHALGRYELIALLGRGGMAEVFLAVAPGKGGLQVAVLKRIRGTLAEERDVIAMLRDEAQVATRLSHPNVVRTLDVGEYKDSTFIVMELIDGQTLAAILARAADRGASVDHGILGRVLCDALAGLHYAHEVRDEHGRPLELVHRDVSPQNLMVGYDGVTKVVDFGVALSSLPRERTQTGILKGRLAYMAPEQYDGEPVDRRADVYALGAVAWEAFSGARLRDTRSMRGLDRAVRTAPPSLRAVAPSVPPALEAVVLRALAPAPEDRFATADDMRVALEAALASLPSRGAVGEWLRECFVTERDALQRRIRAHADTARGPRSRS